MDDVWAMNSQLWVRFSVCFNYIDDHDGVLGGDGGHYHLVGHDEDDAHLCGHGEQGGDAESHPGGHRLGVEPEIHLVKKFLLQ